MPRVSFSDPGQNGDCSPAEMMALASAGLAHARGFENEYTARLVPIQAHLNREGALITGEDMSTGMWQVISLAEISIALRPDHPADSDRALVLMLEAVKEDIHRTARAAVYAEVASALTVAGRQKEADAWIKRARGHITDENNPLETVMGLSRYHLHRGELPEAVAAFLSRPDGYSSHLTAFHMPFAELLLSAMVEGKRDDLLAVLFAAIGDDFESLRLAKPYISRTLSAGRSDAALSVVGLFSNHKIDLLEHIAAHACREGDHALLKRVVAAGRACAHPDYIDGRTRWPKWEARYDKAAARKNLALLLEEGLSPSSFGSGRRWRASEIIQGLGVTGDLDRALSLVPMFGGDDYALHALVGIGEGLIAQGDTAGLERVIATLNSQEVRSNYTLPGPARSALLLRTAGRDGEAAAAFKAVHKATRSTDISQEISRARCAAGDLPGAMSSAKRVRNRRRRDDLLKPIALAYAEAGDLAGAKKVLGEIQEERRRGFIGTEAMEIWARKSGLYHYTPVH